MTLSKRKQNKDLRVDYFQKSTQSSGATPIGCTSGASHESPSQVKTMPTSKAYGKIKGKADLQQEYKRKIKMISDENFRVDYFQKFTQSSGATPIGCTSGPPNEVQGPEIRNVDLQGTSVRQNTSFRVIKAEGDNKKSFLPNYPESISCHKRRPQAGPRIFGPSISKSTQRSGACGGQISPGSTRRIKDLTKGPRAQQIVRSLPHGPGRNDQ
jgi:hypothetical protein